MSKEKKDLVKQIDDLKMCRYLRHLPSSFQESEEYNEDTVSGRC